MNEDELLDLLALMFDAYEEGPDCYEDPDECAGYIGKAVHLDDATFDRIADILNQRRPRNVGDGTTATEGHNVQDHRPCAGTEDQQTTRPIAQGPRGS